MKEIQLQTKIFQHFWNKYPQTRRCIFHIPNGGKRNRIEATHMKASGVVAGIPDLILAWKGKIYGIELKTKTGIHSENQLKVKQSWDVNGNPYITFNNFDDCVSFIEKIILS